MFCIDDGLPTLIDYKITGINYLKGEISYDLECPLGVEEILTHEDFIFSSKEDAIKAFNENQQQLFLAIRGKNNV